MSATECACKKKQVAVIGGGWAGCASAVELVDAGCQVCLFEAAHTLGGRARRVEIDGKALDNGQHILLGAYTESLRLMRKVGIQTDEVLLRLPLQMRYPPFSGGMNFVAATLPAPLHLLLALIRTKGLSGEDKLALARFMTTTRWMDWRLNADCTVLEMLDRFQQTPRLYGLLWRPLCLAALNTPPERASAQIFLNVLRDSIGRKRAASDMLIPKRDLSALFSEGAASWISQRGATIKLGHAVRTLDATDVGWKVDDMAFDAVVIATPPLPASKLLGNFADLSAMQQFEYEPITTCYLQYAPEMRLEHPFYALLDHPEENEWGQFVFDRGCLDATQAGLMAVVVSASGNATMQGDTTLSNAIAAQLARAFKQPALAKPMSASVLSEKWATLACTPDLLRPENTTLMDNLVIAGDYTASAYPATLESAVRSGIAAAKQILCKEEKTSVTYRCSA